MLSHQRVWAAIDDLASRHGLSASGLAKKAGLDSTAFNKSKRQSADGRPRWPSTESISKVLEATGASLDDFMGLVEPRLETKSLGGPVYRQMPSVPLIGFAQAGEGGFFDDGGFPAGQGWDAIDFPAQSGRTTYAIEVQGESMLPLYREGDILIVEPGAAVRRGDRVVVKTLTGEVMAKILQRQTASEVTLMSLNREHKDRTLATAAIDWIARIIWASQ
jgi:phage repressor protein C with HTH and peptisase S24 domain